MKILTHVVFGAGAVVVLLPWLPLDLRYLLAVASSILVNLAIDRLGHTMHGRFVARSPLTHSVLTAPVWGGAIGYVLWAGEAGIGAAVAGLEFTFVAAGVVVAVAHLLLDSLTERGVYLVTGRVALAHFRSDNGALNWLSVALGLALLLT